MAGETRPDRSIVRIRQAPKIVPDLRTGGGVKKMFHDVRDRLGHLAGVYPSALEEYQRIYPSRGESMPYLLLELVPSAIAKAHSPRGILESHRLHLLGARKLEERLIHGRYADFRQFAQVIARAVDLAPENEQLTAWNLEEKRRKAEAAEKSRKTGKKAKSEPVRRSLHSKDLSWGEVAQLSAIDGVRVLLPVEKIAASIVEGVEPIPTLVTTFPFVQPKEGGSGDDLVGWKTSLEAFAKTSGLESIRVLRGTKTALESLDAAAGRSKPWSFDEARPHQILGGSAFVFLVFLRSMDEVGAMAGLPFIQTVEPVRLKGTVRRKSVFSGISPPPMPRGSLPVVGLVDTGVLAPSPLDSYILHRRGDDTIRRLGDGHATDVGYLLVHDGRATPWQAAGDLPCALVDVARINGHTSNAQLDAAVTEGTAARDDVGTVNLSANNPRPRKSVPMPNVSTLGALLDQKTAETDGLMIVNSAGNSGCLGMDSPADAVHIISVGAVTRRPDGVYDRSDYSCHGGGIAHNVKPTFVVPVHDDHGHDPAWTTTCPSMQTGTSIAAPVVARLHANLLHRGFTRDEALVLMIHNAAHPGRDVFYQPSTKDLEEFGFGVVPTLVDCDPPNRARFTLLYEVSALRRKIMTLDLPVPPALAAHRAFVRLSAYTRAPTRQEAGEEYVAAEVPARLRLFGHRKQKRPEPYVDLPPEPEDFGARYERHRVEHGWKWAVLRRCSKLISFRNYARFSLRVGPVIWRDWAQEEFEQSEPGAAVKVQCVLTFYPIEKDAPGFFDAFYSAFVRQNIEMEMPAQARIEVEA